MSDEDPTLDSNETPVSANESQGESSEAPGDSDRARSPKNASRRKVLKGLGLGATAIGAGAVLPACGGGESAQEGTGASASGSPTEIAQARGLSPADLEAAAKTYVPTGEEDDYLMMASGGHCGQVIVIGMPSMRILRVIGVFTPEPWQGWGYSRDTKNVLEEGQPASGEADWGDTHHPALSETDGNYDGEFLFINEKTHARVAVIDLKDFETKQIVNNPLTTSDHGGTFVTPNTEWVVEGGQYAQPLAGEYAPIEEYEEEYRGMMTFWKFDRDEGRIQEDQSFAIELPPYWQDLSDAGKKVSDGYIFQNSFNTEMATGGVGEGNPPFEAGASQNDMDYLHIFDRERAVEVYENGQTETMGDFEVIPLETAVEEGILYFLAEPKSPHGVDVSPDGNYIVISGKLDPNVTVYNFENIQQAIEDENFEGTDDYGVPIVNYDAALEQQIKVGLGPLHTQFDGEGYAYTSLFLESAVARWTLGGPHTEKHGQKPWQLDEKISIHYNTGHLAVAGGDTADPDGDYLVSLNKWSKDRFTNVGPLLPQNFQLIDVSNPSEESMQMLYDMPIGMGEPHYAQIISTEKIDAWQTYPEVGWNPIDQEPAENGIEPGQERVERRGNTVEVWMSATRSHYNPERVRVQEGDHVIWHITNVEQAVDATHGFALPDYNVNLSLEPGETQTIEFDANDSGVYTYYCSEFCSALHLEMAGYFLVEA